MKQILIVEDDSFLNKMRVCNLTADGYDVTSAFNAPQPQSKTFTDRNLIWCCWISICRTEMALNCVN